MSNTDFFKFENNDFAFLFYKKNLHVLKWRDYFILIKKDCGIKYLAPIFQIF